MLGSFKYIGPFYLKRIQYRFKLGYIVVVGPGDHQRQRRPRAVHQQMPFAPVFFPGPWGSFPPLPAPSALC
jgi:hypothetical protein